MVVPIAALVLVVLLQGACAPDSTANVRRYQLTGVVTGHESSPPRVVISHDAVSGLMPAMNMAFEVRSDAPALHEGDRIVSTLVVSDSRSWLENVRITGRAGEAETRLPANRRAIAGASVPEFEFIDQHGQPFTLRKFAGRVLVVTFIYTRCPLPDFCPLMVKHLESIRHRANDISPGSALSLLGITLDPAFDSPDVLRAFGESTLKGPAPFDQWTLATGKATQIEDAARFFGVASRPDGGFLTHTLATSVVSHDGRIMHTFASNSWRPDDLFAVVQRGLERAPRQPTNETTRR